MSIYPVHLSSWFPRKTKKEQTVDDRLWSESAVSLIKIWTCEFCKGKCTWKKAWGHHSIPWGHGDIWCSKACLAKWRKN